jgi:hypothetical protein
MPIYKAATKLVLFQSLNTDGTPNTATTPTIKLSLDGGAQATATNAPSHLGLGQWKVALTAGEMTADVVGVSHSGTGIVAGTILIYTEADYSLARAGKLDDLDATISSRSTFNGGAVASVTGAVGSVTGLTVSNLDATISSRSVFAGGAVSSVTGSVGSVTGLTASNLDAAVSSRSTYAGADTSGTTTLLTRLTSTRAGNLDFLDAAISGVAAAVWAAGTRTLTSLGTLAADTATAVWSAGTRSLTTLGSLAGDTATAVWAATTRTLSAFGFSVTAGTVSDKTGYALTAAYDAAKSAGDATAVAQSSLATSVTAVKAKTDNLPAAPADETLIIAATNAIQSAIATRAVPGDAMTLTVAAQAAVADKLLGRNQKGGGDGPAAQSVAAAIAGGLMEFSISGTTLTVKNADGTTAYTRTLTRAAVDAIVAAA